MSFAFRILLLPALAIALVSVGCDSNERLSRLNSVNATSSSAEPVRRQGNSYRQMLTRKAIRGLDYSSGRVVADEQLAMKVTVGLNAADARLLFENGKRKLSAGRVIESIESLTHSIILNPNRSEYYEWLGAALFAKAKPVFAEAAFRTALDLDPLSVFAHENLALTLSTSVDRFEEAIIHYLAAAELDPENGHVYSRIAILNYYLDRPDVALKYVQLAKTSGYVVPPQLVDLLNDNLNRSARLNAGGIPGVGLQTRVDNGNNQPGNETTAASSSFNPDCVIAGWNDYRISNRVRTGIAISSDGGENWSDFLLRPPLVNESGVEGDPMTAFDNRTGNLYAGAIAFGGLGGVFVARKNTGENEFQPSVLTFVTGAADKCWMAAGPDPVNPNSITRIYVGLNLGLMISTDDGETWTEPASFPEFGLGWLPRIGPNGELYLTYWDISDGIKLVRSFDGGKTMEGPIDIATRMDVWPIDGSRFPGRFRVAPLATSAVDPNNGTLYVTWFDTTNIVSGNANVDIYMTKSVDQGSTWSKPTVINTDSSIPADQFFSWIEVDDAGRLHLLFYDTRSVAQDDNQNDGPNQPPAIIEAYYSYSDDAGESWSEIVLSPQPFSSANDGFGDGFLGDYLGMAVAGTTVYPCYVSTHEGTSNVYVHKITNGFALGDINRDGTVDLLDVEPFVDLIVNNIFDKAADVNEDGSVDLLDVAGFVDLIGAQ